MSELSTSLKAVHIDVDEVVRKAQSDANRMLSSAAENMASRIVSELTSKGAHGSDGKLTRPQGIAYEMARNKIEEYILSVKYDKLLDRLIEEEVEEQARAAIRALLNSRTRKHLFEAAPHTPS